MAPTLLVNIMNQIDVPILVIDFESAPFASSIDRMNFTLLAVAGTLSAILITTFFLSRRSVIASLVASTFSLGFSAFCVFGFMACFEPSSSPAWPWQLAYGVIATAFLVTAVRGLKNAWERIGQVSPKN
ncbi:MAG: hypothetical protein AAGA96_15465 [Verrucomicrobiota bacterium]